MTTDERKRKIEVSAKHIDRLVDQIHDLMDELKKMRREFEELLKEDRGDS